MTGKLVEGQPTLAQQLRKLEIHDGDVLCLPADTEPEHVQAFGTMLAELRPGKRFWLVIGDIQALDETAMNAAGWYRKEGAQ